MNKTTNVTTLAITLVCVNIWFQMKMIEIMKKTEHSNAQHFILDQWKVFVEYLQLLNFYIKLYKKLTSTTTSHAKIIE